MKKLLLSLGLMALTATANAGLTNETSTHKVIMTITPHTDNTTKETIYDTCHYYYNDKGYLVMTQQQTMRYVYELNAQGQPLVRHNYSWVEANKKYHDVGYETYEYNTNGTVKTLCKYRPVYQGEGYDEKKYVYTSYDGDIATEYAMYYNGELWYTYKATVTKNNAGKPTKIVVKETDPDKLISGTSTYRTDVITYQTNGDVKTYKTTPNSGSEEVATYYYADLQGKVPQNFSASKNNGDVTLKWSPVAGATGYIVTFDQSYVPVNGTSVTLSTHVGDREFFVQPLYGDVRGEVSASVKLTITDPGILPAYDLYAGNSYSQTEETESTTLKYREFYYIPLSWVLPNTTSEIEDIIVYYDSRTYGPDVQTGLRAVYGDAVKTLTSHELKIDPFEVAELDKNGELYKGIDTPIYIRIKYESGLSDKSNVIIVNPFDVITGISDVTANKDNANAPMYNIAGQRINNAKGIVIKNGKKVIVK